MGKTLDFLFKLDVAMSNGFQQPMRALNGEFSKLQQTAQALQSKLGDVSSYQRMAQSVHTSGTRLEYLRSCYATASEAVDRSRQRTAQLTAQHQAAANRVKELSATHSKNSMVMMFARKREQELSAAYKQSERDTTRLTRERDKLYRQVGQASEQLSTEKQRLNELGDSLRSAGINTSDLASKQTELQSALTRSEQAQKKLSSIREKLTWGNFKSDLLASTASVMALKAPVNVNMTFEQAMADVRAVARPTAEEFARLQEQAKYLGRTTQFTAKQSADAQQNLIRSGMTAGQVIQAMPAVLNMASAEGLSIEQSSSIIAKGLGGMNLGAELAPRLADILAYTSSHSNTNIPMLGEALKVAGPVLASQGATMEQILSYLGTLANKGYEGSEAGNAIAAAAMRLAKPTKESTDTLRSLGVAIKTRDGRLREIPDIMKNLYSSMSAKKWGEAQQLAALQAVFGKNYGKAMMGFMSASAAGEADKLQAGVYNESFGFATESTKIRMDTLQGDLTNLSSAWEGLQNRIGQTLNPLVRIGTQWLTKAINWTTSLLEDGGTLSDIVITIGAGLTSWKVIATVWKYSKLLVQLPFAKLGVRLAEGGAQAVLTGEKLSGAASAASKFGGALSAALGWLPLIVEATILIYQNWEKITEWATKAGEAISGIDTSKFEAAKAGTLSRSDADYGVAVMNSTYLPPSIPAHAFGGILTTPHVGLVAEAGPEAIIPLRDKSRGIPLVQKAASILGLGQVRERVAQVRERVSASLPSLPEIPAISSIIPALPELPAVSPLKEANDFVRQYSHSVDNSSSRSITNNSVVDRQSPTINITINGAGQDEQSLASRIAEAVSEVLRNMQSLEERVSYA